MDDILIFQELQTFIADVLATYIGEKIDNRLHSELKYQLNKKISELKHQGYIIKHEYALAVRDNRIILTDNFDYLMNAGWKLI